jgi:hypothetical protein
MCEGDGLVGTEYLDIQASIIEIVSMLNTFCETSQTANLLIGIILPLSDM